MKSERDNISLKVNLKHHVLDVWKKKIYRLHYNKNKSNVTLHLFLLSVYAFTDDGNFRYK